jgi:hypothetical protein
MGEALPRARENFKTPFPCEISVLRNTSENERSIVVCALGVGAHRSKLVVRRAKFHLAKMFKITTPAIAARTRLTTKT